MQIFGRASLQTIQKLTQPSMDDRRLELKPLRLSIGNVVYVVEDTSIVEGLLRGFLPDGVASVAEYLHDMYEKRPDEFSDLCQDMVWAATW